MNPTPATAEGLFDMHAALKRLGGSRELLNDMFQFFVEDSPALVDTLERTLAERKTDEAFRAAHSLKGLASNFDAFAVTKLMKQIEEHLRRGEEDQAQSAAADVRKAVEACIAAGREQLATPAKANAPK